MPSLKRLLPKLKKVKSPRFITKFGKAAKKAKWPAALLTVGLVAAAVALAWYFMFYTSMSRAEGFEESSPSSSGVSIVYIMSESCKHCVRFTPIFKQVQAEAPTLFQLPANSFKMFTSDAPGAAPYLPFVSGFPCVFVHKSEEEFGAPIVGYQDKDKLVEALDAKLRSFKQ